MKPLLIFNPKAGGGSAARTFPTVRAVVERRLGPVDVAATERPGHGIELASAAARDERPLVVAVGGDGTFHEVANGLLEAGGATPLGYVGQGTGGDFRRSLGLEHRLDRYLEAIASGAERRLDAGRITFADDAGARRTRWFVNIVSAGMGGLVDRHVAQTSRLLGGRVAYFWAGLRALAASERVRLRCEASLAGATEVRELDAYMIAVCNGRYFGAGMHVAPMADPGDGRFEVVAMDAPGKLAFAAFSRSIYRGAHLAAPGVRHFACDRITIDAVGGAGRGRIFLDVDGEPIGALPLEVELVRAALRIRA